MSTAQPRHRVRTPSPALPAPYTVDTIRHVAPDSIPLGGVRLRRHSRRQLAALACNIDRFGFIIPLVVKANGELVCGHASAVRLTALSHD